MSREEAAIVSVHELTGLQEGIFSISSEQIESGDSAPPYNEQFSCRITGALDPARLQRAWERLSERHAALRTAFTRTRDGKAIQIELTARLPAFRMLRNASPLDHTPADHTPAGHTLSDHTKVALQERKLPFDLARDPLLRVVLIEHSPTAWRMIVTFHHLLADAWSAPILVDDLMALYELELGLGMRLAPPPRTTPGRFADALHAKRGAASRAYWEDMLKGGQTVPLPFLHRSRPAGHPQHARLAIPASLAHRIATAAERWKVSEGVILHAAWGVLLGRITGANDVVFATVLANRAHDLPDIERAVGLFIATVPVRVCLANSAGFAGICRNVHAQLTMAPLWSSPPLADLLAVADIQSAQIDHTMNNRPSGLAWGDTESLDFPRSGLILDDYHAVSGDHYDFEISFGLGAQPCLLARYDDGRIERDTLASILAAALGLLDQCLERSSAPVRALPFAGDQGGLSRLIGPSRSVGPSLVKQIDTIPGGLLATWDGNSRLSYADLRKQARCLADILAAQGVLPGMRVALTALPSADFLVGVLACWLLGASFVPINPSWPLLRRSRVLQIARPRVALGVDGTIEPMESAHQGSPAIAYTIFTSGSTGAPKGVEVSFAALANYCASASQRLDLQAGDRSLQAASAAFDLGYTTAFGLLTVGGAVFWPDRESVVDPDRVLRLMAEHDISVLKITPSYLSLLLSAPDPELFKVLSRWRLLVLGGESPNGQKLAQLGSLCPWLRVAFHYGPTEATIGCAMTAPRPIGDLPASDVTDVGKPVFNTLIKVVDAQGHSLPRGVAGELAIFGDALAEGYVSGDGGFTLINGERAFRSGDQAVIDPAGCLHIRERLDDRIRIRGHWVSPSETRQVLLAVAGVEDAAVTLRVHQGETQLVAFVVATDLSLSPSGLRLRLREQLLDAQIPSQFYFLSRLLLSDNGKLDTANMIAAAKPPPSDRGGEAPASETEQRLAEIWRAVLGVEQITRHDDFFALGGHSLKAIEVSARIARSGRPSVPLRAFFAAPRLMDLARCIDDGARAPDSALFSLLDLGTPARVLCFPAIIGSSSIYREALEVMELRCSVDGFDDADPFDQSETLDSMVREMLACAALLGRRYQVLMGWSFGACLAYEAARQLQRVGQTPLLVMLDGLPGDSAAGWDAGSDDFHSLALKRYWSGVLSRMAQSLDEAALQRYQEQLRGRRKKLLGYRPSEPLRNDLLFIAAEPDGNLSQSKRQRVQALTTGSVRIKTVPADHFSLFHPPHVFDWTTEVCRAIASTGAAEAVLNAD